MFIAAFYEDVVSYSYFDDGSIILLTGDKRSINISWNTFRELYYTLDDYHAAMKVDCILYTEYDPDADIDCYPEWYIDSINNGEIFMMCGDTTAMYGVDGLGILEPEQSIVLLNRFGKLKHMRRDRFYKLYYVPEECYI